MLLWELGIAVDSTALIRVLHFGTEQGIHQRDGALASQGQGRGGCCCHRLCHSTVTPVHAAPQLCHPSPASALLLLLWAASIQLLPFQLGTKWKHG